jgi:hypothetical protein
MKMVTWKIAKNEGAQEALDKLEDRLLKNNQRAVFVIGNYLIQSYPEKKIYSHLLVEVKKLIDEIKNQYN